MIKRINKFKNENELTSRIVLGLFILVCSVIIVNFLNEYLPESKKFDVEIWGTVGEWFMIIVTLITAVFLYKTLDSQMKVQKDQNRIFKIEEKKYLSSIRPKIIITESYIHHKSKIDSNIEALEITFDLSTDKEAFFDFHIYSSSQKDLLKHPRIKISNELGYSVNAILYKEKDKYDSVILEIKYEDLDGNQYLYKNSWMVLGEFKPMLITIEDFKTDTLIKPVY